MQALSVCNSLCRDDPKLLDLLLHSSFGEVLNHLKGIKKDANNSDDNSTPHLKTTQYSFTNTHDFAFTVARCGDMLMFSDAPLIKKSTSRIHGVWKEVWSHDTKKCVDASPLITMKKYVHHRSVSDTHLDR